MQAVDRHESMIARVVLKIGSAMTIDQLSSDPRVTVRRRGEPDADGAAVIYWMQRAQRASDNPALDVAIDAANLLRKPLVVFFGLNPFVERANLRHYTFLAEGLADVARGVAGRGATFVLRAHPHHRLAPFLDEIRPALVVGDENPLRQTEAWRAAVADLVRVPLWTVDADVVVPTALLETEQYAARTIRPRIHRQLAAYLVETPEPSALVRGFTVTSPIAAPASTAILDGLPIDRSVGAVETFHGGTSAARDALDRFIQGALAHYDEDRNHPERPGTSMLSPYLHFGHIGPREVARAILRSGAPEPSVTAFIEQLVVRRELAVNFVRFNASYDRLDGCESWARQTLRRHSLDAREHIYTASEFEAAATADPLWNAAQRQMVTTGWMHNYVRMYWGKKILEWSASPAEAFATAVALNDRYEVDGRDPNGFTNIAWSIGGKHDRPWPERRVYGTIRSMSFASTSRKFDAARYIEQHGRASDVERYRTLTGKPAKSAPLPLMR
jgi:deoxyribodipyrimidine photo-lyase